MECERQTRMCVCKTGYRLDVSGKYCTVDDGTTSPIDCYSDRDCSRLPNSHCNHHGNGEIDYKWNCCVMILASANVTLMQVNVSADTRTVTTDASVAQTLTSVPTTAAQTDWSVLTSNVMADSQRAYVSFILTVAVLNLAKNDTAFLATYKVSDWTSPRIRVVFFLIFLPIV